MTEHPSYEPASDESARDAAPRHGAARLGPPAPPTMRSRGSWLPLLAGVALVSVFLVLILVVPLLRS